MFLNISRLSASNILILIIIAGIGSAVVIFHSHKPTGSTNQPEVQTNSIERLMFGLRLNVLKYFEAFSFKCSSINHNCWYWVCSCYFPFAQTNRKYKPTGSTNQPEAQTNRKYKASRVTEVINAVGEELRGSGNFIGYRQIHQRVLVDHSLVVARETVRIILKTLDPEGVLLRSRHRFRRRTYSVKGPNYIWHLDGYDKLKPFGFPIHGAIDGYSRRILWLRVMCTNNDPQVIAGFYIQCIKQIGGGGECPKSFTW